jgi:hypothetical protein
VIENESLAIVSVYESNRVATVRAVSEAREKESEMISDDD